MLNAEKDHCGNNHIENLPWGKYLLHTAGFPNILVAWLLGREDDQDDSQAANILRRGVYVSFSLFSHLHCCNLLKQILNATNKYMYL